MAIEVRRLTHRDSIGDFGCGTPKLDAFLKQVARTNVKREWSVTWLAVDEGRVAGFVTIVPGGLQVADPKVFDPRLPDHYPVPVLVLARLGTDERFKLQGVGARLMLQVFRAADTLAGLAGCVGVFTDAKPGSVVFYEKFKFKTVDAPKSEGDTAAMFLPLAEVRKQLAVLDAKSWA